MRDAMAGDRGFFRASCVVPSVEAVDSAGFRCRLVIGFFIHLTRSKHVHVPEPIPPG